MHIGIYYYYVDTYVAAARLPSDLYLAFILSYLTVQRVL